MRSTHHSRRRVVVSMLAAAAVLSSLPGARAAEPLRWKLHAGDKFDYVMTQDMAMSLAGGTGGQQANTTVHQQMDMTWDVASVSADGNAVIDQSINRVRMTMNAPMGQGFQYDSQAKEPPTGMAATFAPMFNAMMQGQIKITMTPRGEIVDVEVPDKMVEALKKTPGAANMGGMDSAEGIKKMVSQGSMVLPEDAPTAGENWSTSTEMNNAMMGKLTVDTTYEYKDTKKVDGATCAVIVPTVTTKLEGQGAIPMTIKDQSSSGEILFNEDQGRLESSQIKQRMTIDVTAGGQSTQQLTIDQTSNTKLTPVKE